MRKIFRVRQIFHATDVADDVLGSRQTLKESAKNVFLRYKTNSAKPYPLVPIGRWSNNSDTQEKSRKRLQVKKIKKTRLDNIFA